MQMFGHIQSRLCSRSELNVTYASCYALLIMTFKQGRPVVMNHYPTFSIPVPNAAVPSMVPYPAYMPQQAAPAPAPAPAPASSEGTSSAVSLHAC